MSVYGAVLVPVSFPRPWYPSRINFSLLWCLGPMLTVRAGHPLGSQALLLLGPARSKCKKGQQTGQTCYLAALAFAYHFKWNEINMAYLC